MATRRRKQAQGDEEDKHSSSSSDSRHATSERKLRVAFLHPNLGIGGAERLVVDCASALRQRGHRVHIFTNYHDKQHCYEETRDGTLSVSVYGQTRDSLFGRFRVLIAIARMVYLSLVFALWHARDFDAVVVDQVAHAVPVVRATTRCKVLFYCHFPDQLLSSPGGALKRLYRLPVDRAEEWSTGCAQLLLVNSRFTLSTLAATFPSLRGRVARGQVGVLYPSIDFARYAHLRSANDLPDERMRDEVRLLERWMYGEANAASEQSAVAQQKDDAASASTPAASFDARTPRLHLLTSINRFERKKNLPLAIRAFALYQQQRREKEKKQQQVAAASLPVALLVCGGYDPVNTENREHFLELRSLCTQLGLRHREMINRRGDDGRVQLEWDEPDAEADAAADASSSSSSSSLGVVYFLRSFTDAQRSFLLSHSLCVLYTPSNEHFGIVPVEAQYMRRPVLACASGGPMESVVPWALGEEDDDGRAKPAMSATGFLCEPEPEQWSRAMAALVESEECSRAVPSASGARANDIAPSLARRLGANGRANVLSKFHFDHFQQQLEQHLWALVQDAVERLPASRASVS